MVRPRTTRVTKLLAMVTLKYSTDYSNRFRDTTHDLATAARTDL